MATGTGKKSPVCSICGDESSGFHYGVDSCEGCKGFFRRCITQGMHHRCSNSEKCEITPFTRNSCQYCRLKKCFAVGMSREASRLGRRPKKMKDMVGDIGKSTNIPIAPYPSQSEIYQMRMADLQRILQQNGTYKAELMEAFVAAQKNFQNQYNGDEPKQDIVIGTAAVNGTESGYSSLSSANSSKSQSPVHMGYVVSYGNGMTVVTTNIHTSIASPTDTNTKTAMVNGGGVVNGVYNMNDHTPTELLPLPSELVTVKEEPEMNGDLCNGNVNSPDGGMYFSMVGGDLINTVGDMMSEVMQSQIGNMDDSGMADMDISQCDDFYNGNYKNIVMNVPLVKQEQLEEPVTPTTGYDGPPLLLQQSNVPTPSPLQGKPFFEAYRIDMANIYETIQAPMSEIRQKLIKIVTETIRDAHLGTCTVTHSFYQEKMQLYNEKQALSALPDFKGLDINPGLMWQQMVSHMVPELTKVVKFCKKLPGFQEISQDDQILLIKQGMFEVLLIRFLLLVDVETGEMFDPGMQVRCSRNVVVSMPMGTFFCEFFKIADKFNPLKLNDTEIGLYSAITIMCPDRGVVHGRKNIAKIQSLFYQALYHLLLESHDDADVVFGNLLKVTPLLRTINDQHSQTLHTMKMTSPDSIEQFPALHQEIFDIN